MTSAVRVLGRSPGRTRVALRRTGARAAAQPRRRTSSRAALLQLRPPPPRPQCPATRTCPAAPRAAPAPRRPPLTAVRPVPAQPRQGVPVGAGVQDRRRPAEEARRPRQEAGGRRRRRRRRRRGGRRRRQRRGPGRPRQDGGHPQRRQQGEEARVAASPSGLRPGVPRPVLGDPRCPPRAAAPFSVAVRRRGAVPQCGGPLWCDPGGAVNTVPRSVRAPCPLQSGPV